MASTLTTSLIAALAPYWYARLPFTTAVSLAAGGQASVIPAVANWNQGTSPTVLVTVEAVQTAPDPNLVLTLATDRTTQLLYAAAAPGGFAPLPVRAYAWQSLTLAARNPNTAASPASPVWTTVSIFRVPTAWKVLFGQPITPAEAGAAATLGVETSPTAQRGLRPIPLSAVIERTYANRQIASPLVYDGPPQQFTSAAPTATLPTITVPANGLYVLRRISVPIDADYGPQVTINWETQENFWSGDPSGSPRPLDFVLPFLQQLQVVVTVQSPPPGPVPIRVEVWRLSLSLLLRARLAALTGLTPAALAALYESQGLPAAQAVELAGRLTAQVDLGVE